MHLKPIYVEEPPVILIAIGVVIYTAFSVIIVIERGVELAAKELIFVLFNG